MAHLIWSNEHRQWWRPNGAGYTHDVFTAAGRYTAEEADRLCPPSIRTSHTAALRKDVPVEAPELDASVFTAAQFYAIPEMLIRRAGEASR